uniref:Cupin type-1 domain-containing protein n=1 Tax=Populus trichocarpa TaxID=3694 RepID=A0A2K1XV29_POPTR
MHKVLAMMKLRLHLRLLTSILIVSQLSTVHISFNTPVTPPSQLVPMGRGSTCPVMEVKSFEDEEVAKLLTDSFSPGIVSYL